MILFLKTLLTAQPFTEVPKNGPLNVHLGVQEEGLVKIGFTPPPFIGQPLPIYSKTLLK